MKSIFSFLLQNKLLVCTIIVSSILLYAFSIVTCWAFVFVCVVCYRQGAPVCSVLGKTYSNECLLHKEACRKKRRIGKAHSGVCLGRKSHTKNFFHFSFIILKCTFMNCDVVSLSVSRAECSQEEFGQFPYRLLDWFLLLSRMGERYTPAAPSQSCLTHTERTQLAQVTHTNMPPLYHSTYCMHAFCLPYTLLK